MSDATFPNDLCHDFAALMKKHNRKLATVIFDDGEDLIFLSMSEENEPYPTQVKALHDWLLKEEDTIHSLIDAAGPLPS